MNLLNPQKQSELKRLLENNQKYEIIENTLSISRATIARWAKIWGLTRKSAQQDNIKEPKLLQKPLTPTCDPIIPLHFSSELAECKKELDLMKKQAKIGKFNLTKFEQIVESDPKYERLWERFVKKRPDGTKPRESAALTDLYRILNENFTDLFD